MHLGSLPRSRASSAFAVDRNPVRKARYGEIERRDGVQSPDMDISSATMFKPCLSKLTDSRFVRGRFRV
ncbi:MAG: hypothetical protein GDYSWBUE_000015 [Candidatus Fervidibacterota bacterium]